MSDFIDRAKLQAEAVAYGELMHDRAERRAYHAFLAGAAAYAALLDAETTEEWGAITVGPQPVGVVSGPLAGGKLSAEKMSASGYFAPVSRHGVRTPWLPSEGGEKRG